VTRKSPLASALAGLPIRCRPWILSPLAGALGGGHAQQLGGPLPWMIGALLGVAALLMGWASGLDARALLLGMVPGGIAEMSLTAEALNLLVPLVTAMQVLRLLLVLFLAGPVFRLCSGKLGIGRAGELAMRE